MNTTNEPLSVDANSLPCGVIVLAQNRSVVFCNIYAENTLSVVSSDVVGQRIDDLVTPASRIFIDSYVYPLLFEKAKAEEIQINCRSFEGDKLSVPVIANIEMRKDKSTVWTFMRCDNRDKLFEEFILARDSLSERTIELTRLNDRIQNERDNLQVFCHSLSHDFTAPIQRIRQLLTFAMEDLQSKHVAVDTELEMLKQSIHNTVVLTGLISGLVEYLTADAVERFEEAVDLNHIVSIAIDMSKDGESNNITVGRLPKVLGDAAQLKIIIKNLITNAMKYNDKKPEVAIRCSSTTRKGYINISIADNGIGMSTEYLEKIFEPFARLNLSNGTKYCGSGLGLSIVKKLVSNHNGDISVTSTLGVGSTFNIELPLANVDSDS